MQEKLKENETRFTRLMEKMPVGEFDVDLQGNVIFASDVGCLVLGYPREELLGQPFFKFIAPEDRSRCIATSQNVMAGKPTGDNEFTFIRKDGSPISTFVQSAPFRNSQGEVGGLSGIVVKISRDKSIDAAMRASEEKYRSLINNINLGVTRSSPVGKGKCMEVNKAMEEITGYSRKELLSMNIADLHVNPDDLQKYRDEAIQKNGITNRELLLKKKDGEVILASGSLTPVKDPQGNILYFDGILEDISERKKADRKLKESESKFRILAEQSFNMIFINTGSHIAYVNRKCEELLGYSKEEFYAPEFNFLNIIAPESRDLVLHNFDLRKQGKEISSYEYTLITKDGRKIESIISMSTITYRNKKAFMGTVTDITERKRMEQRNLSLYQQEKKQRQELQEEARARGMFIDVLAHELRTPLTPILACVGMLNELIDDKVSVQGRLAANVYTSSQVLSARLEELLELARYSRGTFKLEKRPVDADKYLNTVLSRFKPSIDQHGQILSIEIAPNLPIIEIDPSRLEQVIINLLSNASKFSPQGGRITFRARTQEGQLLVEVQDEGIGISPEEALHIFQPYHRVEQDRLKRPGLGLGLAVAKQIVEAHNGKIWVVGNVDRGSTFGFSVPINPGE
jgi:PAS domain S-box-containing protein